MLDFLLDLDKSLFILINSHWTTPWADQFFPFITDLHKHSLFKVLFVPFVLLAFLFFRGLKKGLIIFLFCLVAVGTADGLGNWAFKKTFQRPRPPETQGLIVNVRAPFGGYSFISNHATNMFVLATYTTAFFPTMAIPAFTFATLVAYSRVYNGVHFPSDVLAGALFGALVGLVISRLCKKILKKIISEGEHKT